MAAAPSPADVRSPPHAPHPRLPPPPRRRATRRQRDATPAGWQTLWRALLPCALAALAGCAARTAPIEVADAQNRLLGPYLPARTPTSPAYAAIRLHDGRLAAVGLVEANGELRLMRGLVYSASPHCAPPFYIELQADWQAPTPGLLSAALRHVDGHLLLYLTQGHWSPASGAPMYVLGPCEATFGYRRSMAPVEEVVDLTGEFDEPLHLH